MERRKPTNRDVQLALSRDFRTVVEGASFFGAKPPHIERFYKLERRSPPELRLVRFERMAEDLAEVLSGISLNRFELPHRNVTHDRSWCEYLTPEIEAAIYDKYRFPFDFYPRYECASAKKQQSAI